MCESIKPRQIFIPIDLTTFDDWCNNDIVEQQPYPLSVMLKIILFGYSHGLVSSCHIANTYETNITFMSLSDNVLAHSTFFASFVAHMSNKIEIFFTQVLMICDKEGLMAIKSSPMPVKNGAIPSKRLDEKDSSCAVPVNAFSNSIKHRSGCVKIKCSMI